MSCFSSCFSFNLVTPILSKKMIPEYSVTLPYNIFHSVNICSVHLCPHALKTAPDITFQSQEKGRIYGTPKRCDEVRCSLILLMQALVLSINRSVPKHLRISIYKSMAVFSFFGKSFASILLAVPQVIMATCSTMLCHCSHIHGA